MTATLLKMSFNEYKKIDAINSSKLTAFFKDRKLYYQQEIAKTLPKKPEERHFIVGRAIHCAVLEPEKFNTEFMVGDYRQTSNAGKFNLAEAERNNQMLISEDEHALALHIAKELPQQEEWTKHINEAINLYVEVTIILDFGNGVKLKIMCDRIIECADCIYIDDVKSTSKVNTDDFDEAITDYNYIIQAAFYQLVADRYFNKGIAEADKRPIKFRFVFCSKEPPHHIGFICMTDEQGDIGFDITDKLLKQYVAAQRTGAWYEAQYMERDAQLSKYKMQKFYNFLNGVNE